MSFVHVAVWVSDLETATSFYEEGLGLEFSREFEGDDGVRNYFVRGDTEAEIQFKYDPDEDRTTEAGALAHLAIEVNDIDATVERIVEVWDCEVTAEPTPPGDGDVRIAFVTDPLGNGIELIQPA
jgi:lactoylglutathione lyase